MDGECGLKSTRLATNVWCHSFSVCGSIQTRLQHPQSINPVFSKFIISSASLPLTPASCLAKRQVAATAEFHINLFQSMICYHRVGGTISHWLNMQYMLQEKGILICYSWESSCLVLTSSCIFKETWVSACSCLLGAVGGVSKSISVIDNKINME